MPPLVLLFISVVLAAPPAMHVAQALAAPAVANEAPSVSPDGSRIAFVSNRSGATDVYLISPEGTGEVRVTQTPEEKGRPDWSADGREIWFAVIANDASKVYSIEPNGNNHRELASVAGKGAVVSPDARRVVYWVGTWTANRLMVSNLDGTNVKQLTDGSSVAWNMRWSPDGKQIAFSGKDAAGALHVFVINRDGSGQRQLTHLTAEEGRAQVPAWSADGRQIAFQVNQAHSCHIWVVDVATGAARKLAAHTETYLDEVPSWFPDGKRIAFQSNRTGRMEIWVMNADGTEQRQVTR